jgi:hypothetical protein
MCYKSKNTEEFMKNIDEIIDERVRILKFLKENQSKLPDL